LAGDLHSLDELPRGELRQGALHDEEKRSKTQDDGSAPWIHHPLLSLGPMPRGVCRADHGRAVSRGSRAYRRGAFRDELIRAMTDRAAPGSAGKRSPGAIRDGGVGQGGEAPDELVLVHGEMLYQEAVRLVRRAAR